MYISGQDSIGIYRSVTKMDNEKFDEVISFFTENIRNILECISDTVKENTYEIRLRSGKPIILFGNNGSCFVKNDSTVSEIDSKYSVILNPEDLKKIISKICGYSVYTHQNEISQGFVTFGNGHRAGFCGTAVRCEDGITALRDINSLNIRIARIIENTADELIDILTESDGFNGIIIAGAPCTGKTTLLRSFAAKISSCYDYGYMKTVIVDERSEMSFCSGYNCDILKGYSKTEGITHAIRVLSPEIIVCDEVVSTEEAEKIIKGCYSGVKFIISVHIGTPYELFYRPVSKILTESGFFDYAVFLKDSKNPGKINKIVKTEELKNEYIRNSRNYNQYIFSGVSDYKQRDKAL